MQAEGEEQTLMTRGEGLEVRGPLVEVEAEAEAHLLIARVVLEVQEELLAEAEEEEKVQRVVILEVQEESMAVLEVLRKLILWQRTAQIPLGWTLFSQERERVIIQQLEVAVDTVEMVEADTMEVEVAVATAETEEQGITAVEVEVAVATAEMEVQEVMLAVAVEDMGSPSHRSKPIVHGEDTVEKDMEQVEEVQVTAPQTAMDMDTTDVSQSDG